jgi:ABC-type nitrate/sulfonate/bicarbonate transport system substrate-binding protein
MPTDRLAIAPVLRQCVTRASRLFALMIGLALASPLLRAEPLTLAVSRTPLSLPLYIAQHNGYFIAEGLEIKFNECLGGHRCLRMILDGQADVATASDLPIVMNSFSSTDYAVIGTFTKSSDDIKLVTSARSKVQNAAQLAGKHIGVTMGSAGEYFLDLFLLTAGVDPQTLTVVNLQPEELVPALQAGKVDAVAVWQPYGYQAVQGPAKGHVLPGGNAYIQTFNLVSHRKLVGRRDTALTKLLRAVDRAEQFIQEQPDQAKDILRRQLKPDAAFVDAVWPGLYFRLGLDQTLLATMEGEARWARREGHADGPLAPNVLKLVHAGPLRTIKPDAVASLR